MQEREPDSDIALLTLDGTWLSVYPRELLAEDATVPDDGSGFSGVPLAHNVATRDEVDALLEEARDRGRAPRQSRRRGFLGRLLGLLRGPRRPPLGGRVPATDRGV